MVPSVSRIWQLIVGKATARNSANMRMILNICRDIERNRSKNCTLKQKIEKKIFNDVDENNMLGTSLVQKLGFMPKSEKNEKQKKMRKTLFSE